MALPLSTAKMTCGMPHKGKKASTKKASGKRAASKSKKKTSYKKR